MIAVDTNIIIRLLTADEPDQVERAHALLVRHREAGTQVFINRIVFCETVWVLEQRIKLRQERLANTVEAWLATSPFVFEDRPAIDKAVKAMRSSKAGVTDILIGLLNRRAGCSTTYTFDHEAAALESFTAVPPA